MITPLDLSRKLRLSHVNIKDDEIVASCPFAEEFHEHGTDSKPSFSLNVGKGVYYCFTCGSRGNIEQLIKHIFDVDTLTATVFLEDWGYDALELKMREPVLTEQKHNVREAILTQFNDISTEFIEKYQGDIDGKECIIFPVRDAMDELVGGIARSIEGRFHMVLWGLEKSHYLYGEDLIDFFDRTLVVVEGPKDVAAVREAGFTAVALMGAHASEIQIAKIIGYTNEAIIWLDNDAAGRLGTKNLVAKLENTIDVKYVTDHFELDTKGDADEILRVAGVGAVRYSINTSESLLQIMYRRL
jgi:DNA primase